MVTSPVMKPRWLWSILLPLLFWGTAGLSSPSWAEAKPVLQDKGFSGSKSCRACHEKFYQLWAPSRHGLAMQPYTAAFAREFLSPQKADIRIGSRRYRVDLRRNPGVIREKGADGEQSYPIVHVLGGKNVYYFLTLMKKGRLQTLPLAYDVQKKEWFDTAASGIRHFPGQGADAGVHWKQWPYTFNTSCRGCHVSQYASGYDFRTDTYRTTWTEPGINCETCHGPAGSHVQVCRQAPKGTVPKDLRIVRGGSTFTTIQNNEACASCHAKSIPLTATFGAGERFYDHFDLVTLEHPDYYPDGRDLGENYTYTSWLMSPCVRAGQLSCLHCHTSSGRFRQEQNPNRACLPCHSERTKNIEAHSRHGAGGPAGRCVACHMPATRFARMTRTDHSMLPPAPAATVAFKSPNACNLCHMDKDAKWADQTVRQWHKKDYQAPVLHRAGLIAAARKRDWSRRTEMLSYLRSPDRQPIFAASLIRLLSASQDDGNDPVYREALKDPSPLVRSAAAGALGLYGGTGTAPVLLGALRDEYRLVRIKAAEALVSYPRESIPAEKLRDLDRALGEFMEVLMARPDLWTSHYNLGNYYLDRGQWKDALNAYGRALRLEPGSVLPDVNASLAYARMGEPTKAEASLRRALRTAPDNGAANFNLGLLKAEQKEGKAAETYLRRALTADPLMDQAAYNLCLLLSGNRLDEAVEFCRKARDLRPESPKYAYTLAFYLHRKGLDDEAVEILKALRQRHPRYTPAALLLLEIGEDANKMKKRP